MLVRVRRAIALRRVGRIFTDIGGASDKDSDLSDLEKIKKKIEEALVHSVQKGQEKEMEKERKQAEERA